jgi:hypothetical protein
VAQIYKSTTYNRTFFMTLASDHISPATSKTVTVTISKDGGSFASAGGTVTEIANGFYKIALTTTDSNTLGDLAFHCTATACDNTDFIDQVTDPDYLLTRDFASVTGEAARSMLNALRFLRNKWTLTGATLSIKKEDDSTEAWNATVTTDGAAVPVTGSDPA